MRYLSILLFLLWAAYSVSANGGFSVLGLCQNANSYRLEIQIGADISGVLISPSHSGNIEVYESGVVHIPLENEWAEIRAIGVNPAPIEMFSFENLAACETGENEADRLERTRRMIMDTLAPYIETIQEWSGE